MSWKKIMATVALTAALMTGVADAARATPVVDHATQADAGTSVSHESAHALRGRSSSTTVTASAAATNRCPAFVTWEDWIGGARVHAYVDFHPSDLCYGRHVKAAYVRLIRQCGPYYDTGRIYTYTASSPSDTRLYSVSAWIFDSVLWSCNTSTYYGYVFF